MLISLACERPAAYNRRVNIRVSGDIAALMPDLDREGFFCILLNQKNMVQEVNLVSLGTLTASLVHPRECFRSAVMAASARVAFMHNHPSGDSAPSGCDDAVTTRLVQAGTLLGIDVLDHVIVGTGSSTGSNSWYSYADSGRLGT